MAARVAPFFVFVGLMVLNPIGGETGKYWLYLARTLTGAWMLWVARPLIPEMRWAFSWQAVVVGIGVCAMWVGIDPYYPKLGGSTTAKDIWNPFQQLGSVTLAWFFVLVRIIGSSLLVPMLEEVFYRSLLYRFIVKKDFETVPFSFFSWTPFLVTSVVFGFEHSQWLAGILCGMAYQWLVIRKNRLGDAITAHAITNFLLGIWVIWKGAWQFW